MGTPNREPQEYSRNIIGIYLPQGPYIPLYSYYILGVPCLGFPVKSLHNSLVISTLEPQFNKTWGPGKGSMKNSKISSKTFPVAFGV